MGVSRKQTAKNHDAILETAERLFRAKGVDAVGLAELMAEAGFTQGGFYNHFASKDALVNETLGKALDKGQHQMDDAIEQSRVRGKDPLERQIAWYLSPEHRDNIGCGCPMAGLAGDIARVNGESRKTYAALLQHTFQTFTTLLQERNPDLPAKAARRRAIALFTRMAGAVILSRAAHSADPELANEILRRNKAELMQEIARQEDTDTKRGRKTTASTP